MKNPTTPSYILFFIFSSSTRELCSQPVRGNDRPIGRMFPEHVERSFLDPVISLCGRTYQTETAMWGDMFYSATITLVPQVTLVLHGLLPLHPLYNIHVLLHNIWHPLSFEQIPLIHIFQINHTLIKTINLQLFLSPWKTLRLFTMIHSHNNNYSLFFHTQFCLFLTSVKNSVGLKLLLHILIKWIIWNLLISIFITLTVHILCKNTSKQLKYNYKIT